MGKIPDGSAERHELFHLAVGYVVRNWIGVEISLMLLLTQLLHKDQFKARVVWMSMPNLRVRLALIKRLGETYIDPSVLPDFRSLMKRAKRLGQNRNILAHTSGGLNPEAEFSFHDDIETSDIGVDFAIQDSISLRNIIDWPTAIDSLNLDLSEFAHVSLKGNIHTSTRKHRERR